MQERSVIHATFVIERNYPASPERVFAAFADRDRKRRWYMEAAGRNIEEYEMDFRPGGKERGRSRFREGTPFPGAALESDTTFQDILPNRRLVMASTMSFGGRRISASQSTVELLAGENGTTLVFTEQAAFFEGADGPQIREEGWKQLLDRLANAL